MDKQPSPTAEMSIDILSYNLSSRRFFQDCEPIKNIKAFVKFLENKNKSDFRNKVVAYIVLLYSQDSILNKPSQLSLRDRKFQAAEYVEFPKGKTGDFTQMVIDDVFDLKDQDVVECVLDYLQYQNSQLWTLICTHEALFDQYTASMFKNIEIKDDPKKEGDAMVKKKEMRKEMSEIHQDLKTLYKEFFKDHKDVKEHEYTRMKSIEDRARVKS